MTSPNERSYPDGGTVQLPCRHCRDAIRSRRGNRPLRVLHSFSLLGELVDTSIVWPAVVPTDNDHDIDGRVTDGPRRGDTK